MALLCTCKEDNTGSDKWKESLDLLWASLSRTSGNDI